jgi:plasminogen activator
MRGPREFDMSARIRFLLLAGSAIAISAGAAGEGVAADLFGGDVAPLLRTETLAVEATVGYLRGTSREYVYDARGAKLSQLNWRIDNGSVAGGRVTFRPLDWLSVRARGWTKIDADSMMKDYDWLAGYIGFESWTHRSVHPDTDLTKAMQGDLSVAAWFWEDQGFSVGAIAGYRYMTMKWETHGGSYVYSVSRFRDASGSFPDQLGIAYQQWWQTPYLGLGLSYAVDDLVVTGEVIGSGWVSARAKDYHALRDLVFEDTFSSSPMIGASVGVEYRVSPMWSATGRVEYQKYFEAEGTAKITNEATGAVVRLPKPAAGADSENTLVSLGVKARI